MEIELGYKQILEYIILGIKNGNYQAAMNIAQDCLNELNAQEEDKSDNKNDI